MKKLRDILTTDFVQKIVGDTDIPVAGLSLDSRQIGQGFLFAALAGTNTDGGKFISMAIEQGATAIICHELPKSIKENIVYIVSEFPAKVLAKCAANFYNKPTEKLDLIGVTGTNGKTTVTSLLYQFFQKLGYKCGLISTIGIWINDTKTEATHTTPDCITLNKILDEMVDADCEIVFMEVSSHAVVQDRIFGLNFKGGIFTNLSHDHLDYHGTFENYRDAKKLFFDGLDLEAFAITNVDDRNGKFMLQNSKAARVTYALENAADFKGKIIEYDLAGMQLELDGEEIFTTLTGKFNAYNLLAAYACARMLDVPEEKALTTLTALHAPEGRFSCIRSKDRVTGIVDYAHTPDALKNVLESITDINMSGGNIITVVGCGGNRDKTKRPIMGKIAAELSQRVILTSDNPRNESAEAIIHEMEVGVPIHLKKVVLNITDRRQAIKTACTMAGSGDIVLVAGKGHEKYQDINGVKTHFDDKEVLAEYLNERAA
ncbi:MAG: UDP-N-acetylmuramoyl-L-alanyl-D-glutamate--2,6-diaminopimelate ligase [Bacteroidetes bacterium]|nr:UDP-N-acetylmuramoyl-L-alanyl-D-glutamate--2,6-diaminopimelate ligase [Bacteroidota bacterium]